MRIGVFLHDHFFRKHCGSPLHGLEPSGWFLLNVEEALRAIPPILADLKALGVQCVELPGPLARAERMKDALRERRDIDLILHTEGDPAPGEITSSNPHTRRAAVENILRNIDLACDLDARKLVLHPPPFSPQAAEVYRNLAPRAHEKNVLLATENSRYGRDGIDELLRYAERVPALAFTFDVGHANIGFSPDEGAKLLGPGIAHVHLHGNDGKSDQHLAPGTGTLDPPSVLAVLHDIDGVAAHDITVTLECDKPVVDYEQEFEDLKRMLADLGRS